MEPEQDVQQEDIKIIYPSLGNRYKSMVIDGLILVGFMFVGGALMADAEGIPDWFRGLVFVLIFFLYEPLFVSFRGGTIGHFNNGLTVKQNKDTEKNIPLFAALVRAVIKIGLGWLSFLTMLSDPKKRAIHDFASGSIVVYKGD